MAANEGSKPIHLDWVPDQATTVEDLEGIRAALRDHGGEAEIEEAHGLLGVVEGGLVIMAAITLVELAKTLADLHWAAKGCGRIIDATGARPKIKEDCSLARGVIVYLAPNAKPEQLDTRRIERESLVPTILGLLQRLFDRYTQG